MTTENRRTSPRDYLQVAREMMRHADELAAAPDTDRATDVAGSDQSDAAARDARRAMGETIEDARRVGVDMRRVAPELDARSLAWSLAVSGAINRRIPMNQRCPHAQPDARRPLNVFLTSRWLVCEDCKPRYAARIMATSGEDDGRCDVCDKTAQQFSEFTAALGPLHVFGNACATCSYWLGGLPQNRSSE